MSDMCKPGQGEGAGKNIPGGKPDLSDQAKGLGRDFKSKAGEFADTVTKAAKDQATELGTAAKDLANDATGKVKSAMNEQKAAGADYIGSIAQAVNRAAGEFDSDVPQAAQYIRQAAGQIENVANAVRERDVRELVDEVQDFARRQPTLFFGGAVILGFAALRFFKSSAPTSGRSKESREAFADGASSGPHEGAFAQRPAY